MTVHALPSALGTRRLPSWIAGFLDYTDHIWSTDPHRLWTAIITLAGALERKVWIRSQGSNIYPNLYVFLVGPPAVGKTRPIQICAELWEEALAGTHHVAPVSLTKASLMDELSAAVRNDQRLTPSTFNSLLIASKELGALIPNYDPDFLNALTYIYDNIKYDEKRRGNKEPLIIDRPQINLIGATTPSFLLDTLPITAWDQGFLSRVIIIYKDFIGERKLDLSSEEPPKNILLSEDLIADLRLIGERTGKLVFRDEAAARLEAWHSDVDNRPNHPRLQNYNSRRTIHAIKLSIIACIDANHSDIELEDVNTAIDWLMVAEQEMPDLFTQFKSGGDAAVIMECHHYCYTIYVRNKGPIPVHYIYEFLGSRVPSYRVQSIIDVMIRSNLLKASTTDGIGMFHINPAAPGLQLT